MKFTAGAISGLLHQFGRNQYQATEHAGARIDTWWYNHILLLDTVCAVHDTEEDELRVVKWRLGGKKKSEGLMVENYIYVQK